MTKLTDRLARSLEPPSAGSRIVWDRGQGAVPGFGIRITRDGTRAFILNYRVRGSGVERRFTLGRFPADYKLTTAARHRAQELRRYIAEGGDPMGELREHRQAEDMNELADRYIAEHAEKKTRASSVRQSKSLLAQWIRPELGGKKVRDVTRHDVEKLHAKVTAHGTPFRANRVLGLLNHVFALAIKWGLRQDNPCQHIDRNPEAGRSRYLKPEELDRLIAALGEHKDREGTNAIRLLLLTGARRGEVLGMRWEHLDLKAGTWTKPASATKSKREHHIPLSAPARLLLSEMRAHADAGPQRAAELENKAAKDRQTKRRRLTLQLAARERWLATSPFVFPSRDDPAAPMVNIDRVWRDLCKRAKLDGLRVHDLRHSFASFLVSSGASLPLIGQLLGHSQPGTTARYSHLFLDAQRQGAEAVGKIVAPGAGKQGEGAEVLALGKR